MRAVVASARSGISLILRDDKQGRPDQFDAAHDVLMPFVATRHRGAFKSSNGNERGGAALHLEDYELPMFAGFYSSSARNHIPA